MDTAELLSAFFEAENNRDWTVYRSFLSPDVVWELHGEETRIIRGVDEYLSVMMAAYADSDATFVCEALYPSGDGRRVVSVLRNHRGERSCDIFEISGGLIVTEYEFLLS